jgi:hypothetical protein
MTGSPLDQTVLVIGRGSGLARAGPAPAALRGRKVVQRWWRGIT